MNAATLKASPIPCPPWRFLSASVAAVGVLIVLGLWQLNVLRSHGALLVQPLFLISQVLLVGILLKTTQDLLLLRGLEAELIAFQAGGQVGWPQRLVDACYDELPLVRSLTMSRDALEEMRKTLLRETVFRWLLAYGLVIMAIPLLGMMAAFEPLRFDRAAPSPLRLAGPFMLTSLETLAAGYLAVLILGKWCSWLDLWHKTADEIEVQAIDERERDWQPSLPQQSVANPLDIMAPPPLPTLNQLPVGSNVASALTPISDALHKPESGVITSLTQQPQCGNGASDGGDDAPRKLEEIAAEFRDFES